LKKRLTIRIALHYRDDESIRTTDQGGFVMVNRIQKLLTVPALALVVLGAQVQGVSAQVNDIDISAFVDFNYQWAFNKTDPELRTFDVLHNSFTMSYAEVSLEKMATSSSRVGGRIDLGFGPVADIVGGTDAGGSEVFKHVQQAYISVMPSENFTLDVGKFVTPIGAEVIESQDNWNYSRSILFGYAIPFQHTGVRATVAANDQVSVSGFLLNGWNNSVDNNNDKTFAASVAVTPSEQLSWVGNIIAGKEADFDDNGEEDLVWLFDTTLSFQATETVSLMGNYDYGSASNYIDTDESGSWWGFAAYARLQAQENWALAGRYEYVDDSDSGFMTIGEKAQSFTVTSDHNVLDGVIARVEFRLDNVAQGDNAFDYFTKDDGSDTGTQPSLTVGVVYALN